MAAHNLVRKNSLMDGMEGLPAVYKLGLMNSNSKYLTAETFGFKINAGGPSLRKKQIWTIEFGESNDLVYLKSHLGRYVSADKMGNVTCDAEDRGSDQQFILEYEATGQGRWAFKSKTYECYLGGTGDNLRCKNKQQEWWCPHLAIHPQVNMRNLNRKRYVHLMKKEGQNDELQCTEVIPWGADCLVTIEYTEAGYALKSFDNRYVHMDGTLVDNISSDTLFCLQLHAPTMRDYTIAGLVLKHGPSGKYLTAVGAGTVKCRNQTITKDEVFIFQESQTQVSLVSTAKWKRASVKQGVDVSCNQEEMDDTEIFQMELVEKDSKPMYRFRTNANKFWTVNQGTGGIQAAESDYTATDRSLFSVQKFEDGLITIQGSNGNYVTAKSSGALFTTGANADEAQKFAIVIVNRPLLVLKGEYGFVGYKTSGNPKLECNKSLHDIIRLEYHEKGQYYLSGLNGMYWNVKNDGSIVADGAEPEPFYFEFQPVPSKFALKASNGKYVVGEQNGTFWAKGSEISGAALWEY